MEHIHELDLINYEIATKLDSQPNIKKIATPSIGNEAFKFYERLTLSQTEKVTTENMLKALEHQLTQRMNVRCSIHVNNKKINHFLSFLNNCERSLQPII